MRVLIAGKHPPGGRLPIGGVQSWMATVGAQLRRMGHEVTFWGPEWPLRGRYDIGILANLGHTAPAMGICRRVLRVSHGIIPDEAGGAGFAATSEEVAARWGCTGPIVRQPLDLGFWTPGSAPRTLLVRHSYRGGLEFLPERARALGLGYMHLRTETPESVRAHLQRAAVVVATGRAAVEAMACGAAVVIADARHYQGPLLDPEPAGAMVRNYSGRGGVEATEAAVAEAVRNARPGLREHAEQHHDVRKIAAQLLEAAC